MEPSIPHQYDDFEIHVLNRTPAGYPVYTRSSRFGEGRSISRLDPDEEWIRDVADLLHAGHLEIDQLEQFGALLLCGEPDSQFHGLLRGSTLEHLRTCIGAALAVPGQGLHLRLRLEPSELAALPFEYLFDPARRVFLATDPRILLARVISTARPIPPLTAPLPLRGLLIASGAGDLEIDREVQAIRATSERTGHRIEWSVIEGGVTLEAIQSALRTASFHVLHFSGHGVLEQQGLLYLNGSKSEALSERALADLALSHPSIRLVVLNACQSGQIDPTAGFGGMAQRLLNRDVPAVVAMQQPVSDASAVRFATALYDALLTGPAPGHVTAAVNAARAALLVTRPGDPVEFGAPVVYLRSSEGVLFHVAREEEQPEEEGRAGAGGGRADAGGGRADAGGGRADAGGGRADAGGGRAGAGGGRTDAGGGRTDAGGGRTDAGGARTDAGGGRTDAGGARTDAGGGRTDAGGARTDTGGGRADSGGGRTDAGGGRADAGGGRADAGGARTDTGGGLPEGVGSAARDAGAATPVMAPRATGLRWLTLWLGIILLAVSARQTGLLERADSWRQDRYVRTFTPGSYDSSVVIVDLTDGVAPWPWPRATLARLLDRLLNVAHVKAVVLDVVLSGQPLGGGDAGGFQQANQQIAELVARARTRDRPQTVVFALSGTLVPEGRSPGAGLAGSGAAGSGAAGSGAAGSGAAGSGAADSGAADSGAADSGAIGSTPASASHAAADAGQLPDLRYHLCIDPDNLPPPELRDVPRGFAVLLAPHFYGGQVRQAPLVATPELPDGSSPYCPPVAGASSVAEMVNAVLPMPPVLLSLAAAGAAGGGWPGIDAHAHQVRLGDRWIGTDDRYRIEIPYIDESFPAVIDAAEVLSDAPRGQAALERLRDKVTVIGRHVSEKWDYRPTAWGHRTGVSIQAGIVSALVSGETRHRTDPLLDLALQIVGLAVAGLVLRKLDRALPRLLGALGLLGLMVGVEIIALTGYHVWLDGPVLELSILTTLALRSVLVTTSARSKQPQKT